jgi:hypothetical protein
MNTLGQTEGQTVVVKDLGTYMGLFGPEKKKLPLRNPKTGEIIAMLPPGTVLKVSSASLFPIGNVEYMTPNQIIEWAKTYPSSIKWSEEDARKCNTRWIVVVYHRGPLDDVKGVVCAANVEETTKSTEGKDKGKDENTNQSGDGFDWKWVAIGGAAFAALLAIVALTRRK